jgi:hypothetical protein
MLIAHEQGNSTAHWVRKMLCGKYKTTDVGTARCFRGIQIMHEQDGSISKCQKRYKGHAASIWPGKLFPDGQTNGPQYSTGQLTMQG